MSTTMAWAGLAVQTLYLIIMWHYGQSRVTNLIMYVSKQPQVDSGFKISTNEHISIFFLFWKSYLTFL